jgi:hypothetical protein
MNRTVRRVLTSLVGVVCPPDAQALGLAEPIVDHVGLSLGALPPRMRQALALGVLTYDLAALAWPPARGRRAHRLPRHLAARYFERWLGGPTPIHRQLAIAVKQLLVLGHYEQPAIQERLGYRPAAWIAAVKRRRLDVYADDIARHQASLIAPDPLRPRTRKEVA